MGPSMIPSSRARGSRGARGSARRWRMTSSVLTFDSTLRELERVEQLAEPLGRELRLLSRDVADRASFLVRLLRDRRALVVADHGVQGRDEDRIAVERVV